MHSPHSISLRIWKQQEKTRGGKVEGNTGGDDDGDREVTQSPQSSLLYFILKRFL
jgi:hypothetical protein